MARRNGDPAGYPGEEVIVALFEQSLVAIQLGRVKSGQVMLGKAAEQQITLQSPAISAAVAQALATEVDRLADHGYRLAVPGTPMERWPSL